MNDVTATRWRQIKDLLEMTLDVPAEARASHLRDATHDDDQLRREVEALLDYADDDFLETSTIPPIRIPTPERYAAAMPTVVESTDLLDLPPYSGIRVLTRRTRYELVVVAPLEAEVIVHGGRRFHEPVTASLLNGGRVICGQPLSLRSDGRRIVTSPVQRIEVTPPPGPAAA